MARIISVHGTFAKWEIDPASALEGEPSPQWWETNSAFRSDIASYVEASDGELEIEALEWTSENSERDRRSAARRLYTRMTELEADGEPYCIVGHSHGGTIIASALMEAASKKQALPGLRRWITVGTPFLDMRPEKFLFSRLPLVLKAAFVASMMLFVMFAIASAADIYDGVLPWRDTEALTWFAVSLALTSLPWVLFSAFARWQQGRQLYAYRKGNKARAREYFASRWLPLSHEDDEVVTGLTTLGRVRLDFFHENFAVSALTFGGIFLLPILYFVLLNSPQTMRGISQFLQTTVYDIPYYEREEADFRTFKREIRKKRRALNAARERMNNPLNSNEQRTQGQTDVDIAREQLRTSRRKFRSARRELQQTVERGQKQFPELPGNARALSFKEKFLLKPNGTPCNDRVLCGGGENKRINSRLLFHLVTDEVSRLVTSDAETPTSLRSLLGYALPILIVPLVFMALAVLLLKVVQLIAGLASRIASHYLDALTWGQVKRTALGNDTEAELAVGAMRRPYWIEQTPPRLPAAVGDRISAYSNEITAKSLAKFRNALSELAFADRAGADQNAVLKFFTWRELVHAAYFEVPLFRRLVAAAIAETDGFRATNALSAEAGDADITTMLAALRPAHDGHSQVAVAAGSSAEETKRIS
ncbi:MAG: hypothetical protein AAFZ01_12620 [Pseudomonadota bacterium]